jgi:antitoxin HicB
MRTFTYGALLEPGEDRQIVVVTFPDVPEAITEGDGRAHALEQAEEALGLALLSYPKRDRPLPRAGEIGTALVPVTVAPEVAAKLAFLEAFRDAGMSKTELARRLGKDEKEVRRLLDPMHPTKLPTLNRALGALGQRLVIGVEPIAATA